MFQSKPQYFGVLAPTEGLGLHPRHLGVPFHPSTVDTPSSQGPLCTTRDQFVALTDTPEPSVVPPTVLSSYQDIAWDDESTLEWDVRQVAETTTVEGFTNIAVGGAAVGQQPQDPQLVLMLPTERFDLEKGALVGIAREALLWWPGFPLYCKLVNRSKETTAVEGCRVIARPVALNVRDPARFESLFDETPSTVDPHLPRQAPDLTRVSCVARSKTVPKVQATDANLGTRGPL